MAGRGHFTTATIMATITTTRTSPIDTVSGLKPSLGQRELTPKMRQAKTQALLQIWLSPAFPVGAFAYSHGIEAAVDQGWVGDRQTLKAWLADLVKFGSLRNDLIFLACAWRAAAAQNYENLREIVELAAALQPSAERFLEATQQGRSFLMQIEASWPPPRPMPAIIRDCDDMVHAVAVGIAAALHEIPIDDVLLAHAIAFVGNLLSAAIRLSVIGPTEGQQLLSELTSDLIVLAAAAETSTLDDLGGATWRSDIASLLHETQHTRLFRS